MLGEHGHTVARRLGKRPLGVLAEERRAVVDQVQPAVPDEQVRVAGSAVDVRHERVEPDHIGGQVGIDGGVDGTAIGSAPGRKSIPRFAPGLPDDQVLDLGIGLGKAERRCHLHHHELGHRQPDRARQLARHHLGHERRLTLARRAELRHVQALVVGLHQPGQRTALPQRGDVARGGDMPKPLGHGDRFAGNGTFTPASPDGYRTATPRPTLQAWRSPRGSCLWRP